MKNVTFTYGNQKWLVREAVDDEQAMRAIERCMAAGIPGARFVWYPRSGQGSHYDAVVLADVQKVIEQEDSI